MKLPAWCALWWLLASVTRADPEGVELTGIGRTRPHIVVELLPREPPSEYTDAELREAERRIANLGVFDHVAVSRRGDLVAIDLREKWTLIPDFSLATGKTPRDLSIALGVTEYNVAGTASTLSVSVYREQRGFGFSTLFNEHESRGHRWSYGGTASYGSASLRFGDGNGWFDDVFELMLWSTSIPIAGNHLRVRPLIEYEHDDIDEVDREVRPPGGHGLLAGLELIWDGYRFHDLIPSGVSLTAGAGPGVFVPTLQQRHWVGVELIAAQPLAKYTVLTGRWRAHWKSRGNANFSALLGSIEGVRGLEDALYRNWAQTYLNVELRQSIPIWERLALQLVVFADGAVFAELDARGARASGGNAFSGGLGTRVLPTFLSSLLFRVDVARLVVPYRDWFVQLGAAQYF